MHNREIHITIDIEWTTDDILEYVLQYLEEAGVAVTFFVTHATPMLDRIRQNPKFELGIHPNFNNLLQGKSKVEDKDFYTVLQRLMEIVPEARSVRSHCLTQSSILYEAFKHFNLLYDCNPFIPVTSNIVTKPWRYWNGMTIVPCMWSDYQHCMYGWDWEVTKYIKVDGLKVFAFHPLHIALNIDDISIYHKNKDKFRQLQDVMKFRCRDTKRGIEVFLQTLISKIKEEGYYTRKISDITEESIAEP